MTSNFNRINILCVFLLVLCSVCNGDVVHLKDGKKWEGHIIREDDEEIVLQFAPGARIILRKESVESIERATVPDASGAITKVEELEKSSQPAVSDESTTSGFANIAKHIFKGKGTKAGNILSPFLVLGIYVYFALSLHVIANKTGTGGCWMAWIPILNVYLLCKAADKPGWWLILFLIPFVNIILIIIVWCGVASARGKPGWLGILMLVPFVNIVLPGYLAFSGDARISEKEAASAKKDEEFEEKDTEGRREELHKETASEKEETIPAKESEQLNVKGMELREKRLYDDAIVEFKKAIELQPGFAHAYFNLALTYEDKSMVEDANRMWHKVVEIEPLESKLVETALKHIKKN